MLLRIFIPYLKLVLINPLTMVAISKLLEMIDRSTYAAKSGEFISEFSWVARDPIGVCGLISVIT